MYARARADGAMMTTMVHHRYRPRDGGSGRCFVVDRDDDDDDDDDGDDDRGGGVAAIGCRWALAAQGKRAGPQGWRFVAACFLDKKLTVTGERDFW